MNVTVKDKEIFAGIVLSEVKAEVYQIRACGIEKTNMELYDKDSLYLKIKSIETCQ